jgi:hypothetical protein
VKVKNGCVGIFHADTPALHGRETIDTTLISTLGRGLEKRKRKESVIKLSWARRVQSGI